MSRMKILNAVEQEQFESPPAFNSVQRKQYFDFSSELLTLAQDLQTATNQVRFLVNCGYFKADMVQMTVRDHDQIDAL